MILIRKSVFSRTCPTAHWTFIWKMRCSSMRIVIETNSAYYFTLYILEIRDERSSETTMIFISTYFFFSSNYIKENWFIPQTHSSNILCIRVYEGWMAISNCISRLSIDIRSAGVHNLYVHRSSILLSLSVFSPLNNIIIINH